MTFLEYMVSHMEYSDITTGFGLGRVILWGLVQLLAALCNAVENLYNHIFSLISVVYSEGVIKFLQGWMQFLWIPIGLSVIYLGYNLIMGDATQGSVRIKTFARNLCILVLVIFGLPYLFVGHGSTSQASLFVNSTVTSYQPLSSADQLTSDSGLLDFFAVNKGQGLINGVDYLAHGSTKSKSTKTSSIIASNLIDLKTVYTDTLYYVKNNNGSVITTYPKGFTDAMEKHNYIRKNQFYRRGTNATVRGSGILDINIWEKINSKELDEESFGDEGGDDFHISDVLVSNHEFGYFPTSTDSVFDSTSINNAIEDNGADPDSLSSTILNQLFSSLNKPKEIGNSKPHEAKVKDWLFGIYHRSITRYYGSENIVTGVVYSNDGATAKYFDFINPYVWRYKFEWGALFIELVAAAIVLLLTSYKIARIIYELTLSQFLAIFFGAADLSSGQKIKEVIRYIFSLVVSLFFAVVMVEFYFIISEAVNNLEFVENDGGNTNNWIRAIVQLFVAIAAVKGPAVLEKILGVEGGLSGAWRDVGTATRPMRQAAKGVAKGTAKLAAKGTQALAQGAIYGGYMMHQRHRGNSARTRETANGNQSKVGSSLIDTSRAQTPGQEGQFTAIRNDSVRANRASEGAGTSAANGRTAANESMARQSRDIANQTQGKWSPDVIQEKYGENIRNAALAEKAADSDLSDHDAVKNAYMNHGMSETDAERAATHDISTGAFAQTQERFENSISAQANENYNAHPSSYNNINEAYQEAAENHYQALGFDKETATEMATPMATQVLADDKQEEIRSLAQSYMGPTPVDKSEIEALAGKSDVTESTSRNNTRVLTDDSNGNVYREDEHGNWTRTQRMTEEEAIGRAAREVLDTGPIPADNSEVHCTKNTDYNAVAQHIHSQGSLKEGITSGRIANNIEREHAQTNTRSESLNENMNPALQAAMLMSGNYFKYRSMQEIGNVGYSSGRRSRDRKIEKRTKLRSRWSNNSHNKNK